MLMKKICRRAKNRENRYRQHLGAAENLAAGLTARHCDVSLTSTWFEATLLDVSGSPDLPDMNVTNCHCGFFIFSISIAKHLYLKRGVARMSCSNFQDGPPLVETAAP